MKNLLRFLKDKILR